MVLHPTTDQLRKVDKLVITFLVDNSIEWMTKLPPGFTHELPQHIQLEPKPDDILGVPVLNFDNFCCGAHGFSALIETEINEGEKSHSYLTLFDTGPDSLSLVRNVRGMKIPTDKITRIITSHWHSDHTGGLLSFLKLRKEQLGALQGSGQVAEECGSGSRGNSINSGSSGSVVVDVHPDRPIARGIAPGPNFDKVVCALPRDPTFEEIEEAGGVVEKHAKGHQVAGGTVWVSGEIPRVTDWETGILGGRRWMQTREGEAAGWIGEPHIMDERYAAIDVKGKGLVIFSACSHAGIVNVVKDALAIFQRPIFMVIGGLHLAGPEFGPRILLTVDFLSNTLRPAPTYVLPMHCSGFQSKIALEKAFGEGCVPAGVGLKVSIVGDSTGEEWMHSPVIAS